MPGFGIQPMSSPGGDLIAAQAEYIYAYHWKITKFFDKGTNPSDATIHLKDATLPTFTVGRDTVLGGSLEYKFAKSVCWEDVRVTWYDTTGLSKIMKEWRDSVWTEKDGLKSASSYKKDSVITTLDMEGRIETEWTLKNSWPAVIREGDLTYTASDVKVVEVTIAYDWAVSKPFNGSNSGGSGQ